MYLCADLIDAQNLIMCTQVPRTHHRLNLQLHLCYYPCMLKQNRFILFYKFLVFFFRYWVKVCPRASYSTWSFSSECFAVITSYILHIPHWAGFTRGHHITSVLHNWLPAALFKMRNKQEVSAASRNHANETSTGARDSLICTGRNRTVNKGSGEHFAEGWVGLRFAPHIKIDTWSCFNLFPLPFNSFLRFFFRSFFFLWAFRKVDTGNNLMDLGNVSLVWFDIAMLLYLKVPHCLSVLFTWLGSLELFCTMLKDDGSLRSAGNTYFQSVFRLVLEF